MILRVDYLIEEGQDKGKRKIADINNIRIRTEADKERVKKLIENSFRYEKVRIFNWKIIGSISDKIGKGGKYGRI